MTTPAPLAALSIQLGNVLIESGSADPSVGGLAAAIGSLYPQTGPTGKLWLKTTAPDTGWSQIQQSFNWYSVRDFGAVGNGIADDTAAFQGVINACAAAGGGVVYVPSGTYAITQITISGQASVQLMGAGMSSIVKWVWNAGGGAGSMLEIEAASAHTRVSLLRFDGSGLTNPAAGRSNHLILVGSGAGGDVVDTQFFNCQLGGMVAGSGDGIHVVGSGASLIQRLWIVDNVFDGCSRYSIGVEQGLRFAWIEDNYLTNCETEIAFVATANVNTNAIEISKNQIVHTSGSVAQAIRLEGDETGLITKLVHANNTVITGFVTMTGVSQCAYVGNIQTSGDYATTDGALKITGNVTKITVTDNLIDRTSGSSVGPCVDIEAAGGAAPNAFRVGKNMLVNERKGGGFIKVVDCSQWSAGNNLCRSTDADADVMFGIEVQAVTANLTDILIGPQNQITAAAEQMQACVRLLCNGANIVDISVVGNQGDNAAYGLQLEQGLGGGTFTGQLLYAGNNIDSSTGDINQVGVSIQPRIGFNAGVSGANLFQGSGSPEGVVTAKPGSVYLNELGGQATTFYYKESGTGNTGWIAVGGSLITFGAGDLTTASSAVFFAPGYVAIAVATELQIAITRPANVRNLRVQVQVAGTGAATVTYTVRKNGADTALTTSLANTATGQASDLTHTVSVVAGDLLSCDCTKSGGVAAGQTFTTATVEFV